MLADEAVEEDLVAVVQLGEEDPAIDIRVVGRELLVAPSDLLVRGLHRRGQHSLEA